MLNNSKGFALIEIMIAMVIILVGLLGLVQATLLSIDNNLRNLYRDEAVRIADETMNVWRSRPVDDTNLPPGPVLPCSTVLRNFRNVTNKPYTVCTTITNLLPAPDSSKKSVQVIVGWNHKYELALTGTTNTEFQHTIMSIVGNPL
jgi:type IV pilus assembly protein PilV